MLAWKPIALIVAVCVVAFVAFNQGQKNVQQKWDREATRVANALVKLSEVNRAKEQSMQQSMNEVQTHATQQAEALRTAADSADASANRLRVQVDTLLAADRTRQAAGTCASSTPTKAAGNMLAGLLDKSVTRNRELAAFADSAMNAARSCQSAYNSIQQKAR